jgi:hypothetical protein
MSYIQGYNFSERIHITVRSGEGSTEDWRSSIVPVARRACNDQSIGGLASSNVNSRIAKDHSDKVKSEINIFKKILILRKLSKLV